MIKVFDSPEVLGADGAANTHTFHEESFVEKKKLLGAKSKGM